MHTDDSQWTINLCLYRSDDCEGGDLRFYMTTLTDHDSSSSLYNNGDDDEVDNGDEDDDNAVDGADKGEKSGVWITPSCFQVRF